MIKIKDFVDVNLTSFKPYSDERNKTVVYVYGDTKNAYLSKDLNASNYKAEQSSFDQLAKDFINQFFALDGASLRVIRLNTDTASSLDIVSSNNQLFLNLFTGDGIEDDDNEIKLDQVAVVLREASTEVSQNNYDATGYHYEDVAQGSSSPAFNGLEVLLEVIEDQVESKGTAYRKLVIKGHYTDSTYSLSELEDLTRNENLVWKLCAEEKDLASVLAYLSKVTLVNPDSLKDYSFTEELTCANMKKSFDSDVEWSDIKEFVNVDIDLEGNGSIINLGGNTSAGFDLIQEFESVYISQRLVTKELSLLKNKINISEAKSIIHSAIIDVMEIYNKVGYLVQTQYNGNAIYRKVGNQNICILAPGEVITAGYKVVILPKVNKDVREFPEIELVINTNKGIRYIKTTGVVL